MDLLPRSINNKCYSNVSMPVSKMMVRTFGAGVSLNSSLPSVLAAVASNARSVLVEVFKQ